MLAGIAAAEQTDEARTKKLSAVDVEGQARPSAVLATTVTAVATEKDTIDAIADIAARVPNLRIGGLGGRAGQHYFGMRGFINAWSAAEAPALIRIDGVEISDPISLDQRLVEVERIEVLHGPQGTRFGANASAGAIDIVTRAPADATRSWASLGIGQRGYRTAGAGISGAVAPGLVGSIGVIADGSDGNIDNRIGARPYNAEEDRNLQGRLEWRPGEGSLLRVLLLDRHSDDRGGEQYLPVDIDAFNMLPTLGGIQLGEFEQAIDEAGFNRIDATTAALSGRWEGDVVDWSAQWSVRRNEQSNRTDYDLSPQPWFVMASDWRSDERRAELIARSADDPAWPWQLGLASMQRDFDTQRRFNAGASNPWLVPPGAYVRSDAVLDDRDRALFGEVAHTLDAAGHWRIGMGTRMQWSQRQLVFGANATDAAPATRRHSDRQWQPKVTAEYRTSGPTTLTASVARGGRPGGFNPGTFSAEQAAYRAERMTATEIAINNDGESRIDWQLAAFDNRVDDYQELNFSASEFTTYLRNVERVIMRGLEARIDWQVDDRWQLGAMAGTVNARYQADLLDAANGFGLGGRRLSQIPRYNAAFDLGYSPGPWFARVEWLASAGFDVHVYDASLPRFDEQSVPGHRRVNVSAGWRGERWSLLARAENLGDVRWFNSAGFGFGGVAFFPGAVGSVGERRRFELTLRYEH